MARINMSMVSLCAHLAHGHTWNLRTRVIGGFELPSP